jgi:hypothetical protein
MKESSYQKLKRTVKEKDLAYKNLWSDFRKYANGDFNTKIMYDNTFDMEINLEKQMWSGNTSFSGEKS